MCIILYGAAGNVHTAATCPSLKENTLHPIVIVSDCKRHLEIYILSFVAENSLRLSFTIKLIEFFHFLSTELKTLAVNSKLLRYRLKCMMIGI